MKLEERYEMCFIFLIASHTNVGWLCASAALEYVWVQQTAPNNLKLYFGCWMGRAYAMAWVLRTHASEPKPSIHIFVFIFLHLTLTFIYRFWCVLPFTRQRALQRKSTPGQQTQRTQISCSFFSTSSSKCIQRRRKSQMFWIHFATAYRGRIADNGPMLSSDVEHILVSIETS